MQHEWVKRSEKSILMGRPILRWVDNIKLNIGGIG
jgi:hypothetical protein